MVCNVAQRVLAGSQYRPADLCFDIGIILPPHLDYFHTAIRARGHGGSEAEGKRFSTKPVIVSGSGVTSHDIVWPSFM